MFRELKEKFTKELVLAVLDLNKKIRMEVDMLDYAIEGVIYGVWGWEMEANGIPFEISKWNWKKLWDSW